MSSYLGVNPLSYEGVLAQNPANVIYAQRAPLASDIGTPIGTIWIYNTTQTAWILTQISGAVATWAPMASGAVGGVITITGDSGGPESPLAGNFKINGTAGRVTVTGSANTQTITLPNTLSVGSSAGADGITMAVGTGNFVLNGVGASTYTIGAATTGGTISIGGTGANVGAMSLAPGTGAQTVNIAASTGGKTLHIADGAGANAVTLGSTNTTSATTINSGSGNITLTATGGVVQTTAPTTVTLGAVASTGLDVSTAAGTGVAAKFTATNATTDAIQVVAGGIKVPVTAIAGASPQICNDRFGEVKFSGVNIALNTDQAFEITNSVVTGTPKVLLTMSGATTGSALSIKSVNTSVNGKITVTVTNGNAVGIVTSVADITFTFWVLN